MGWEPGQDGGTGGLPGPWLPGVPARDPRLSGFARDGEWDRCPPSSALAVAVEGTSGPGWRCAGASRDEMVGLLRGWAGLEAWAAAGRLGVLRALIRDDDEPLPGGGYHGDLPDGWTKSLTHEVAAALAVSVPTAEAMMWLAWDLEARLPGIAALLADGALAYSKARAVDDTFQLLSDADAARAEALILAGLPGKNYGQVKRLAEQAAVTVDPGAAARRREDAERSKSRVTLSREDSGALALSGRDLPADETLAAHARVCARAQEYKESGAFPRDTRMDQFRAAAYVDLLNGVSARARIASGALPGTGPTDGNEASSPSVADPDDFRDSAGSSTGVPDGDASSAAGPTSDVSSGKPATRSRDVGRPEAGGKAARNPDVGERDSGRRDPAGQDQHQSAQEDPAVGPDEQDGDEPGTGPDADGPDGSGQGDDGLRGDGGPGGGSPGSLPPHALPERPPRLADLVVPLVTLLGLAERPGEGHGIGPLDPELCRALAASAAASPFTRLCVTVTDPDGVAIGHGCAKQARRQKPGTGRGPDAVPPPLPARVNLTIPAARLAELASRSQAPAPPGQALSAFARGQDPGPPGGFGTWTLTLNGGGQFTVRLEPVPTFTCDHRHESHAYQPNDALRHLVQIRDGECTFPPCSRHARETDFEHATPYEKGGRTCACNAGARSRQCHRVKQSEGWNVTQPRPGWHQWETPAGRVYTQGPKRYPH